MNMVMRVYRNVLLKNPGNREDMLMFADMLEDLGAIDLAHAYRWAANFKVGDEHRPRWPFTRHRRWSEITTNSELDTIIYDWDNIERENVIESARLPEIVFRQMVVPLRITKAIDYGESTERL